MTQPDTPLPPGPRPPASGQPVKRPPAPVAKSIGAADAETTPAAAPKPNASPPAAGDAPNWLELLANQAAQRHDPITGLLATVHSEMQDAVTRIGNSANKVLRNLQGKQSSAPSHTFPHVPQL